MAISDEGPSHCLAEERRKLIPWALGTEGFISWPPEVHQPAIPTCTVTSHNPRMDLSTPALRRNIMRPANQLHAKPLPPAAPFPVYNTLGPRQHLVPSERILHQEPKILGSQSISGRQRYEELPLQFWAFGENLWMVRGGMGTITYGKMFYCIPFLWSLRHSSKLPWMSWGSHRRAVHNTSISSWSVTLPPGTWRHSWYGPLQLHLPNYGSQLVIRTSPYHPQMDGPD